MELLLTFLGQLNIMYIVLCNAITYVILQLLKPIKKLKQTTGIKRAISAIIAILLGITLHLAFAAPVEPIFYGFFLQFISWDYFFKPIIERIKNIISGKSKVNE